MSDLIEVTAAILIKDNRLLIAQQKSKDRLPNKWEFPGGKVEIDETPEECLKREMKEEFGIDVTVREFLGESVYHYDQISIRLLAYRTFWNTGFSKKIKKFAAGYPVAVRLFCHRVAGRFAFFIG